MASAPAAAAPTAPQAGAPPQLSAADEEPEAGEVPTGLLTLPADTADSLVPTDRDFDAVVIGGGDDNDEAVAVPSQPLTAAERKTRAKKQATVRRDEEEILQIGANREMKLKEILEDAEQVRDDCISKISGFVSFCLFVDASRNACGASGQGDCGP